MTKHPTHALKCLHTLCQRSPLSPITTFPMPWSSSLTLSNKSTSFEYPCSSHIDGYASRPVLPLNYMISLPTFPSKTGWYLLPKGLGLCRKNMNPGQNLFSKMFISHWDTRAMMAHTQSCSEIEIMIVCLVSWNNQQKGLVAHDWCTWEWPWLQWLEGFVTMH